MITKATILIRCLNEVKNLKILLPLLEKQTFQDFEIVFIDSGSTDGSYKFVESYNSKLKIILETIPKDKCMYTIHNICAFLNVLFWGQACS